MDTTRYWAWQPAKKAAPLADLNDAIAHHAAVHGTPLLTVTVSTPAQAEALHGGPLPVHVNPGVAVGDLYFAEGSRP